MRFKPSILLFSAGVLATAVLADEPKPAPPAVKLVIEMSETQIQLGQSAKIAVRLENSGDKTVSLVMPGDGSESGWRTPIVGWSVIPADGTGAHPHEPPRYRGGRCGNVNPIRADEVFSLAPGESKDLSDGWVGAPSFPAPGKYRLVLIYKNDPTILKKGVPLGEDAKGVIDKIKASTPVLLKSNEITITVTRAGD